MSKDAEGFIQSGPMPSYDAGAILSRRHVQGWNEALEAAAKELDQFTYQPYEHPSKSIRALKIDAAKPSPDDTEQ